MYRDASNPFQTETKVAIPVALAAMLSDLPTPSLLIFTGPSRIDGEFVNESFFSIRYLGHLHTRVLMVWTLCGRSAYQLKNPLQTRA